ncbi:hypothetical protein [Ralstonia syzygii]|uniref:hypothetical protein n=1 Tax=Ralstonia syzygii TaxID=28097 RepID=UPI0036F37399
MKLGVKLSPSLRLSRAEFYAVLCKSVREAIEVLLPEARDGTSKQAEFQHSAQIEELGALVGRQFGQLGDDRTFVRHDLDQPFAFELDQGLAPGCD